MAAAHLKHPGRMRSPRKKVPKKVRVTDHALVRWLSRVEGVDMEFYRRQIFNACAGAAKSGATRLRTDACDFIMFEGAVITVVDGDAA